MGKTIGLQFPKDANPPKDKKATNPPKDKKATNPPKDK